MTPSQEQYDCTLQQYRELEIEVIVKDRKLNMIDIISGLVEDGSFNMDADADIRRTVNLTILLTSEYTRTESEYVSPDVSNYWQSGNVYWFDKFIQLRIGIKSIKEPRTIWYNLGHFMVNAPSVSYDAETNSLSIEGVDLMAYFTGLRNGQLEGVDFVIPQDTDIVEVMSDILTRAGVVKTVIYPPPIMYTPYEIRVDAGSTIYDLLTQLRDINSGWEMYFDEDATFIFRKIPTGNMEKIGSEMTVGVLDFVPSPSLTDKELDRLLLNWNLNTDFENVKNYIEVLGKTHEPNYYATKTSIDSMNKNKLIIEVPDLDLSLIPERTNGQKKATLNWVIAFTVGDLQFAPSNDELGLVAFRLKYKNDFIDGTFADTSGNRVTININNNTYVMRISQTYYFDTKQTYQIEEFLGNIQARGVAYEDNPESPFYVGRAVSNVIRMVCIGGDYNNIYSDDLAVQRAKYELYLHSRLHDSITINCVPVYWLGVNELIQFTPKKLQQSSEYDLFWLVKSISIDLSAEGTQTINAIKYYSEFPSV